MTLMINILIFVSSGLLTNYVRSNYEKKITLFSKIIMSVISEYNYITNEELIENIKAFCSAYTKDSVESQILY